jgi:hypothetical protein
MLEGIVGQAIQGLIGGMFERDQYARNLKRQQTADAAAATAARGQQEQMYADLEKYGSAMGPETLAQAYMEVMGIGKNTADVYKTANPGYEQVSENLGGTQALGSFNKKTGAMDYQQVAKSLDPTQKYQSDATTRNAGIAAGASKYSADRAYDRQMLQNQGDLAEVDRKHANDKELAGINNTSREKVAGMRGSDTGIVDIARAIDVADEYGDNPMYDTARQNVSQAITKASEVLNAPGVATDSEGYDLDGNPPMQAPGVVQPTQYKVNLAPDLVEASVVEYMKSKNVDEATARAAIEQYMVTGVNF